MARQEILAYRRALGLPHWKPSQRRRLRQLIAEGATIAYCCTDAHGRPANGGASDGIHAHPGLVQEVQGPLEPCSRRALHATFDPHKWRGSRVWVVALLGEVVCDSEKLCSLRREFLGEVLPEEAMSPSVGVRLGRKDLTGASLCCAELNGANLHHANLRGADLHRAYLYGANLNCANLCGANLCGANLCGADLCGADLCGANLHRADLRRANLPRADLCGADFRGANLCEADLRGADLRGADLHRADLRRADLCGADFSRADLSCALRDITPPDGWAIQDGRLRRA